MVQRIYVTVLMPILQDKSHDISFGACFRSLQARYCVCRTGLQRKAIKEGKYGVKLAPETENSVVHFNAKNHATIYMMIGNYDAAIDKIEYLPTISGELSIPLLKINPHWAPLRDHTRFKEFVEAGK
jgi:hypothetical protein